MPLDYTGTDVSQEKDGLPPGEAGPSPTALWPGEESMRRAFAALIKKTPLYPALRTLLRRKREAKEVAGWERRGRTLPPPHRVKQTVLKQLARQYGLTVFIETGTFDGDMVDALKGSFSQIYSIELSPRLHERAKVWFQGRSHIRLLQGDSATILRSLVEKLTVPALFWLDAHYSAGITAKGEVDTPILAELTHILAAPDLGHVIVIDDARAFGKDPAYPTISELCDFIRARRKNVQIQVEGDSVRVIPGSAPA